MKLIKAFQDLLMTFSQKEVKHYIGLGNPNAKILIIGKECAHEEGSTSEQQECSNNYNQWMNLVEKGHGFINEEEIPQWDGSWETFCHLLHIINLNDSLLRGRKVIRLFRVLVEHLRLGIIIRNSSIISENLGNLIILSTPLQLTFIRTVLSQN